MELARNRESKVDVLGWEGKIIEGNENIEHEHASQEIITSHKNYPSTPELSSESSESSVEGRATRTRKQPAWMTDYETNL